MFVATRIHGKNDESVARKLNKFLNSAQNYADHILIATEYNITNPALFNTVTQTVKDWKCSSSAPSSFKNITDSKSCSSGSESEDEAPFFANVHVLPITGWDGFTPALNALAREASRLSCEASRRTHILFQSLEVLATCSTINALRQGMNDSTLACGAALEGHQFHATLPVVHLSGATCPWNTLCLWSLPKLLRTGFLSVSDGHPHNVPGGIEEVACVAVQQKLFPTSSGCTLIKFNDDEIVWKTSFVGTDRQLWHEKKNAK